MQATPGIAVGPSRKGVEVTIGSSALGRESACYRYL